MNRHFAAGLLLSLACGASAANSIPSYGVSDIATCSGLSAGAFVSVQFHVAFSKTVNGSAIIAGGPYFCAEDMLDYAETRCMDFPEEIDVDKLVSFTNDFSAARTIDDPSNLADDRVWVLSATDDTVVKKGVVEKTATYFANFLSNPSSQLASVYDEPGEHSFLTNGVGSRCTYLGSPYINDCSYDAAGAMFQHLFDDLVEPSYDDDEALEQGSLIEFDQSQYVDSFEFSSSGLYDTGYIYVPNQCANATSGCRVHIAFHGCEQTIDDIGDLYVKETGYNRWAAANDFIILYPQAKIITKGEKNPKGCFDWWGYTDSHYATQSSVQMSAVYKMFQDLQ